MARISRKRFSEILRSATLHNICGETSGVESLFIKIAGIDSRPVTLLKKISTKKVFSTSSERSNMN